MVTTPQPLMLSLLQLWPRPQKLVQDLFLQQKYQVDSALLFCMYFYSQLISDDIFLSNEPMETN